jgi:hypothetical protein
MAQDPNKVYLSDGSEARFQTKEERNANYKASRQRFLAQREKYKNTPMPPQTAKEKADAARPGRISGAEVAAAKLAKRMAQGTQAGHAVTSVDRKTGKPN